MARAVANPRRSNGTRRDKVRATVRSWGRPCAICGGAIDYSLPPGHPYSFEVDEIVPVSLGGSPYDPDNLQPAHRCCNIWRGNRTMQDVRARLDGGSCRPERMPPRTSTDW